MLVNVVSFGLSLIKKSKNDSQPISLMLDFCALATSVKADASLVKLSAVKKPRSTSESQSPMWFVTRTSSGWLDHSLYAEAKSSALSNVTVTASAAQSTDTTLVMASRSTEACAVVRPTLMTELAVASLPYGRDTLTLGLSAASVASAVTGASVTLAELVEVSSWRGVRAAAEARLAREARKRTPAMVRRRKKKKIELRLNE